MASKRIVVLGAGYAGLPAAKRLANRMASEPVEVTMVNAAPDFVERPRLHQMSTGQAIRPMSLRGLLEPSGVRFRLGTVTAIDPLRRQVVVDEDRLSYDLLVYALGSTVDLSTVPGVAEHAYALTDPSAAARLCARAERLRCGRLVVCGGGLTGIEAATELAESYPSASVSLVSRRPPGEWLSEPGRRYLDRALDRLGVRVRGGVGVREVSADAVLLDDGTVVRHDGCVWAGGFTVPTLARETGLRVDAVGRIVVDRELRSVSHPDIYAIGDAAAVSGRWGPSLAMGCRSGGFTGPYVADTIAARLVGRMPKGFDFRYVHECVSLGRRDGLIQFVNADNTPKRAILTGRLAARYKELVLSSAGWLFRWPGPYVP